MNRTDQAAEPSMEEILASIRLIISDDAKRSTSERQDVRATQPAVLKKDAALSTPPEEEVFDLTDELVFPEEHPAPAPAMTANPAVAAETPSPAAQPAETGEEATVAKEEPPAQEQAAEPSPEPAAAVEAAQEPAVVHTDYSARHETAPEPRPEPVYRPAPTSPSRTIWSRRELPGAPAAPARARIPLEPSPARPSQRSWADDIQMPIPDRGPVPLIEPGETQAQIKAPAEELRLAAADLEHEMDAPESLGEKEEAAVAALTESLARSAASAMDEEELTTARDVNFAHLHEERKAEVTDSFAKAIERESATRERSPLPTLLDEVFREDFAQAPALEEPEPEPEEVHAAPAAFSHEERAPSEDEFEAHARAESGEAKRLEDAWPFFPARTAPSAPLETAEALRPERHVAQAQFVGTSPAPAAHPPAPEGSQTLEGAVREMLRPMLKQWLNDNMPRILETAIREEIAARGLPKVDN
jgi:cell pole-organizing protein PopZ